VSTSSYGLRIRKRNTFWRLMGTSWHQPWLPFSENDGVNTIGCSNRVAALVSMTISIPNF
jgi:hypothetical protein